MKYSNDNLIPIFLTTTNGLLKSFDYQIHCVDNLDHKFGYSWPVNIDSHCVLSNQTPIDLSMIILDHTSKSNQLDGFTLIRSFERITLGKNNKVRLLFIVI